ncbi:MAG: hypothetical protein ACRDXD_04100 [Acidimicrobiia bacterium]
MLKGWRGIPEIQGDLDLIVDPNAVEALIMSTWEFLRHNKRSGDVLVECRHIPEVPRILARLPGYEYADAFFEVDFATVVPLRGFRAVTYERIERWIIRDPALGYPRTEESSEQAIQFLFGCVGWYRLGCRVDEVSGMSGVVSSLIGAVPARLLLRASTRTVSLSALLTSAFLLAKGLADPVHITERIYFRAGGIRCPFDPRRGRVARTISGGASLLVAQAIGTGHRVEA